MRGKLNSGVELKFDEQDLALWRQCGSWPRSASSNSGGRGIKSCSY
jgi:hypothetical protein